MYGIDPSRDKSRDFDLASLTSCLKVTAKFSLTVDKIYFLTFKQFTVTIATTNIAYQSVFDISEVMTNLDIVSLRSDVTVSQPQGLRALTCEVNCDQSAIGLPLHVCSIPHHHHHQPITAEAQAFLIDYT
jgi:hypothetical protein